jgi:tetratricopeptide (TPR) repeat protein
VKDPLDWWTWFVLGRVLQEKKDYSAAEVAFGSCISLRPNYSRGLEHRGLMLVYRALGTTKAVIRADLLKQAERDSQTAARLAPHDFSTHWVRGDMDRLLGKDRAALDAYAHALVLIRRLQAVPSLSSRHKDIKEVVDKVLAQHPNDAEGLALNSLLNLAQAKTAAEIAEPVGAFAALARDAPQHLLTRLGHAQALERLAMADAKKPRADLLRQALTEYAAVSAITVAGPGDPWKHVEAWKGRARVLLGLQQPRQAEQAWQEARRLAPLLPATPPVLDDEV